MSDKPQKQAKVKGAWVINGTNTYLNYLLYSYYVMVKSVEAMASLIKFCDIHIYVCSRKFWLSKLTVRIIHKFTFSTGSSNSTSSPVNHQSSACDEQTLVQYEVSCRQCLTPVVMTTPIEIMCCQ